MAQAQVVEGDRPQAGEHCPRCGYGVLQLIGEDAEGYTLRCWNCDTTASIHKTEPFIAAVHPDAGDATGFTLTLDQYAARGSSDPEQSAARTRAGDSTVSTDLGGHSTEQQPAAPPEPGAEIHPADGAPQGGGE